jgi:hypothetical protein
VLAIVVSAKQKRLFIDRQIAAGHNVFDQIGLYLMGKLGL